MSACKHGHPSGYCALCSAEDTIQSLQGDLRKESQAHWNTVEAANKIITELEEVLGMMLRAFGNPDEIDPLVALATTEKAKAVLLRMAERRRAGG